MEKKKKPYCTAIVLAAGRGKRMGTKVQKQYLLLAGRPVLYYALRVFQDSEIIDEILLITGKGEEAYCREEIVEKYDFTKVSRILAGGEERYDSVWKGLQETKPEGYVFIHDGARPFIEEKMLERVFQGVQEQKACVVGMPVKDTIKVVDSRCDVTETPDRSTLWLVQTPQVFETELIRKAYKMLMQGRIPAEADSSETEKKQEKVEKVYTVTDDAGVVEAMLKHPVRLTEGSYMNIKITTPEDLLIGEAFAQRWQKEGEK